MKVTEHLDRAKRPLISYEIIPPVRGGKVQRLLDVVEALLPYEPPFIDITSHAAQVVYEESGEGIRRRVTRKRPGTLGVCALLQNKYNIDAVPHVLCRGFTREETEDFLIELNYLGIDNVLAVQGDDSGYEKPLRDGRSANRYASDLVSQIRDMNAARYLSEDLADAEASDFCVGVGGYPEKHFECPNIEEEIRVALRKVEAGADYIVTQMFFDNSYYHEYVARCREAGITIPIIPGLKILTSKAQVASLPRNFFLEIPSELTDEVAAADPKHVMEIGVNWARKQAEDLLNHNVPSLHFYIMQRSKAIRSLLEQLDL
ncbi:MAG: methylenetetrahydrofolate reductase [NAD(P)H] [Candidatus Eisenbacteria bacterium]|uniref:Methylenetetrahydrofolate reductase n=1 Tax=Eiseniibacteriota bacterium TaxID=2212470 RepID=A0A7Y2E5Y2_UNCEI|nr:methylenetetrahydrofolate reductase [NAD(P)H] [Candidatus Eisenbacteria bacterium]